MYTKKDIISACEALELKGDNVLFVESDLSFFGAYEDMDRQAICKAHFDVLRSFAGEQGTIVVNTNTFSLCNKNIPFDPEKTPSEMGVFSEYFRQQEGTIRSFHPFVSFTAIGKDAARICNETSSNAYGPCTPMERMIEKDTTFISLGLEPFRTCTAIHQVEYEVGVPYRYHREYLHPVVRGGKNVTELFHNFVWYYQCNIKKDNRKLWENFKANYDVKEVSLGRGKIYAYSMKDFYSFSKKILMEDRYAILENPPESRPYTNDM